ncbi:MAG: hypothetical protein IJW89_04280 [Clostridia bacterium]|nr:hypothetical protein [Clostridia bacterium]
MQSVYYDCKNYTANLFRFEDKLFFRSLHLFDERVKDRYIIDTCSTFDAVYENLPIIETRFCPEEARKQCGLTVDCVAQAFDAKKIADGVLQVTCGDKSVIFYDDRIKICADSLLLYGNSIKAQADIVANAIALTYNGAKYRLRVDGATVTPCGENIEITAIAGKVTLFPEKV